jgi:hypothetical protein
MVKKIFIISCFILLLSAISNAVMRGGGGGGGGGGDVLLVGDDTTYTGVSGSLKYDRFYIFGTHSSGYEAVASGTPTEACTRFYSTDSDNWKICVYDDSDNSLLGCSDGVSGTTPGLNCDTFTTPGWSITATDDYLLSVVSDGYVLIDNDGAETDCVTSSSCWWQFDEDDYATPPDPWVYNAGSSGKGNVTIYINGTPP